MAAAPGSQFNYCSGCSHVLSAILQQTTGMNPRDFADQYLFKPLGITNVRLGYRCRRDPHRRLGLAVDAARHGQTGLPVSPGWTMGRASRSSPSEWVENATRTHTKTDGDLGYGYQWWTYPSLAAYTALGR